MPAGLPEDLLRLAPTNSTTGDRGRRVSGSAMRSRPSGFCAAPAFSTSPSCGWASAAAAPAARPSVRLLHQHSEKYINYSK